MNILIKRLKKEWAVFWDEYLLVSSLLKEEPIEKESRTKIIGLSGGNRVN